MVSLYFVLVLFYSVSFNTVFYCCLFYTLINCYPLLVYVFSSLLVSCLHGAI